MTDYRGLAERLERILGAGAVITDADKRTPYAADEGPTPPATPDLVMLPADEAQAAAAVRLCAEAGVPIVPRGAGTGLCGGCVAAQGGVVISLERMQTITDIDARNFCVVTQPGVVLQRLHEAVEAQGLFYPPDPNSLENCSVGGTVATSAGGPRCVKYGITRNYLQGVRAVLPDGRVIAFGGRFDKISTGYNLAHLLCGSEGTLGLITEVTLRLIPKPKRTVDLLVPFADFARAAAMVPDLLTAGFRPALIEYIDGEAVRYGEQFLGKKQAFSTEAEAQFIIQLDGDDSDALLRDTERLGEFVLEHGALEVFMADERADKDRMWELRRNLTDAIKQAGGGAFSEDVVVPRARIPELLLRIRALKQEFPVNIASFGHIGDGNVHVYCVRNGLDDTRWEAVKAPYLDRLFSLTRELGGTISGEHGIGLTKRPYLRHALGESEIELMRSLKRAVDPRGLCNPGKIF